MGVSNGGREGKEAFWVVDFARERFSICVLCVSTEWLNIVRHLRMRMLVERVQRYECVGE